MGILICCYLFFSISSVILVLPTSSISENNIILVTGFEPFDVYDINPSEQIALQLNNTQFQNHTIKGYVLPVNYTQAPQKMKQLIDTYNPDLILSLGLSGKAKRIQVERIAVNLRINPEAKYTFFTLRKVNMSGPWIQQATYNFSRIRTFIKEKQIPVELSYSAGFYLCNAILYETLFYQQRIHQKTPAGFIHLPQLESQHPKGMTINEMITAVYAAIDAHI